jgi:hypothetical protein
MQIDKFIEFKKKSKRKFIYPLFNYHKISLLIL